MADGTKFPSEQKDSVTVPEKISENDSIISSSSDDENDDEVRCNICDKAFSGIKPFEQHIQSRKHAKAIKRQRVKAKMAEVENDITADMDNWLSVLRTYVTCESCGKEFGGPESYQQHLASKGHKRKLVEHGILEQVKEGGNVNMNRLKEMYKQSTAKTDANPHDEISDELKDKSFDDLSEGTYECKPCGNVFTGLQPFIQHIKSKRHSKMEKETEFYEMLKANSTKKSSSARTEEENVMCSLQIIKGILTCELCKASFSGYESALSHIKGKRHLRKLETQKWMKESKKSSMEGDPKRKLDSSHLETQLESDGTTVKNEGVSDDGKMNYFGKETYL